MVQIATGRTSTAPASKVPGLGPAVEMTLCLELEGFAASDELGLKEKAALTDKAARSDAKATAGNGSFFIFRCNKPNATSQTAQRETLRKPLSGKVPNAC